MEEQMSVYENCLMIKMPKEVDHFKAEQIRQDADKYLQDTKVEHIVFDFSSTEFMDSSGIGVIAGRYQKVACFGGRVVAIHVSNRVKRILCMSGLQNLVEIVEEEK